MVSELKCILDPVLPEVSVSYSTTLKEQFTGLLCQGAGERQDREIRSPQLSMIVCKHQLLYNSAH